MRGHLTIEAALVILIFMMILELWVSLQHQWPSHPYRFLEGEASCDIDCLLKLD